MEGSAWQRLAGVVRDRVDRVLGRVDDPVETLWFVLCRQRELLEAARRRREEIAVRRVDLEDEAGRGGGPAHRAALAAEERALSAEETRLVEDEQHLLARIREFTALLDRVRADRIADRTADRTTDRITQDARSLAARAVADAARAEAGTARLEAGR